MDINDEFVDELINAITRARAVLEEMSGNLRDTHPDHANIMWFESEVLRTVAAGAISQQGIAGAKRKPQ